MSRNNQQRPQQGHRPQQPIPAPAAAAPAPQSPAELFAQPKATEAVETNPAENTGDGLVQLGTKLLPEPEAMQQSEQDAKIEAGLQASTQQVADAAQAIIDAAPQAPAAEPKATVIIRQPGEGDIVFSGVTFHQQTMTQIMHGKERGRQPATEAHGELVPTLQSLADAFTGPMAALSVALSDVANAFAIAHAKAREALNLTTDPSVQALLQRIVDL